MGENGNCYEKLFLLLLLFFFVILNAFTQNFTFQWINDMSLYLGRYTRDIPDVYHAQEPNGIIYGRIITDEISEGFQTRNNVIIAVLWSYRPNSDSFLYYEYDRYINIIKNQIGDPLFEYDENRQAKNMIWNWNSKMLTVQVSNGYVAVVLSLPEAIGITQSEWDEIVNENQMNN